MAVGGACGLMAAPASALELGELRINSSLGQRLHASIAYALNPHEELYDYCVYVRQGVAASGLPVLARATVSVSNGTILLTGSRAIREPLLTMQLSIDCPDTAHLSREYTLMINPATPVVREGPIVVEPSATSEGPETTVVSEAPKSRPPVETRRDLDLSPISEDSRYLVQRGDSLSDIASRISDRPIALWPAVQRIFMANPDAFLDGDVNRLKAGSWLEIPDLSDPVPEPVVAESLATVAKAPISDAANFSAYTGHEPLAVTDELPAIADQAPARVVTEATEVDVPAVLEADASESAFADLQPGDVVVGNENPFISPTVAELDAYSTIDIPDADIPDAVIQPLPVVNTGQSNDVSGRTSGAWSWLIWLGGTGLALILGLLLFGQRFRRQFESFAFGSTAEALPNERRTDARAQTTEAAEVVDSHVRDASPHSTAMSLDADFGDGSGLQDASDMHVAQDFGFSTSNTFDDELDLLLPEGADREDDSGPTDIIKPSEREAEPLVLESEVLPSEGDDTDYDLSMIVDVTKQDVVESDATEKDLQAVLVDAESTPGSADYTLSQDVDYKILEQDYEEELTATQALNAEITKAAAKLVHRL